MEKSKSMQVKTGIKAGMTEAEKAELVKAALRDGNISQSEAAFLAGLRT